MKSCKPSRYAVISGQSITYGFRCSTHKIATQRYSTLELREVRLKEHILFNAAAEKKSKKKHKKS